MALSKVLLGELIEAIETRNTDLKYGVESVRGISNNKEIMPTKAEIKLDTLHKFYVINPGEFTYNPRTTRMGEKVGLGYNNTEQTLLFTFNNLSFGIKESAKNKLSPDYLYMFFNRAEFDRYAIIHSWGSATELFSFEELCNMSIELPDVETQRKYVAIYRAMQENQRSYEKGLDDLKLVCDSTVEDIRRKIKCEMIGPYIERHDIRNGINGSKNVMGVSVTKQFREPTAKVNREALSNYKVVKPSWFTFVQTTNNEKCFAYALNTTNEDIVVTSVNEVFSVNEQKLIPGYLSLFFNRTEFDRYARFHSWGTARETFTWDDLQKVTIPIPTTDVQKAIANIYNVYLKRREINERLKANLKNICPILIRGAVTEAMANS